jgi:hypothetical protein
MSCELCKQLVQPLFSGKDKRLYELAVIKCVPCNQMTRPYITHKTTLVVLPLCVSNICDINCEQEQVEPVESTPELVYCSAHLHQKEVSQGGSTAGCILTFIRLLSRDKSYLGSETRTDFPEELGKRVIGIILV